MRKKQCVSITLDIGLIKTIDKKRGRIPRSIFIEDIIKQVIK